MLELENTLTRGGFSYCFKTASSSLGTGSFIRVAGKCRPGWSMTSFPDKQTALVYGNFA